MPPLKPSAKAEVIANIDTESFRLVDLFALPNGDTARLYAVERTRR